MKKLITLITLVAFTSGCTHYGKMYQAYLDGCSDPSNQKKIVVPLKSGDTMTIAQGCSLQPPVDADAKWVNLTGTLGGAVIQAGAQVVTTKSNNKAQQELYKRIGEGGDTIMITGDGNQTATRGAAAGSSGGNLGNTTTATNTETVNNTSTTSSNEQSNEGGGDNN